MKNEKYLTEYGKEILNKIKSSKQGKCRKNYLELPHLLSTFRLKLNINKLSNELFLNVITFLNSKLSEHLYACAN